MKNLVPSALVKPRPAASLHPLQSRRGLGHLARKLMLGRAVTVAYLGGSITSAPGYRPLTTEYLRKKFPGATITEVDAGCGGTDSQLGAFRLHADVLVHKPDLIFVEFAVNDGEKNAGAQRNMEGIVRHSLRQSDPQPEICFVYTLAERHMDAWRANELPVMAALHDEVAEHYRLPSINVAMAMARDVIEGKVEWTTAFSDTCHPTPAGHQHYAATIARALDRLLGMTLEEVPPRALPEPMTANPLEHGQMHEVTRETPAGTFVFEPREKKGGWEPFAGVLRSDKPGAEAAFEFEGKMVGLYFMLGKDGGDVEWSVDDSPFQHARFFDQYALTCTRPVPMVFTSDLPAGRHTLRVRVSEKRDDRSVGNVVEVGALLFA